MRVELKTNAAKVSRRAQLLFADQMPFATSLAINDTVKDAQRAQERHMREAFTVRRPGWFIKRSEKVRSIKIKPFSTKQNWRAVVRVEPPGGPERAEIITRHEERGRREPHEGRALAVPIEARPTKKALVKKSVRPAAFKFKRVATRGSTEIYKGRKRTFMIRHADGSGAVLQRVGPGKSGTFAGTQVLYRLKKSVPIAPRLEFFRTMRRVVEQKFAANYRRAFRRAVRTRKR